MDIAFRDQLQESLPLQAESASTDTSTDACASDPEIRRPSLTLRESAYILGKSVRSLERSLVGRWGNKLPQGWTAYRINLGEKEEWRLIPPPGFRIRQPARAVVLDHVNQTSSDTMPHQPSLVPSKTERTNTLQLDHPTILIDRTDDVERLLRELLHTQKALSEERRLRLEDLRLMTEMQGSMRLLETNASNTEGLKAELAAAQQDLANLKESYRKLLSLPWWKQLFRASHRP